MKECFGVHDMRAIILAAGEGTRLRGIAKDTPKVLMPINGVPLLEHTLLWLRASGVAEVAINLHYQGEKIEAFVGDGSAFGIKVTFSKEERLLGTAGAVKRIEEFLSDPFLVVYGDVLTDLDIRKLEAYHRRNKASVTLMLCRNHGRWDVGVVRVDKRGRVQAFSEKPSVLDKETSLMSGAIFIMSKQIVGLIPALEFYDFGMDLFPTLIAQGYAIFGHPLREGEYLLDIGTPYRYEQANHDAAAGLVTMSKR